jgi:glyoxylase-like metal-dependent hydrolase (beta-lactamase superfamily II)
MPAESAHAVEIGGWRVTALSDGSMRLDGGAMWGVVPRVLWQELTPPDERHTIELALRPFLAEKGPWRVLIEPGIGPRWSEKERRIYAITTRPERDALALSLEGAGVEPDSITHVVATHCHWDHFGGAQRERGRSLVPLCPRAAHFAPASEIERALHPDSARKASYRSEDVAPLVEAGRLEGFRGTAEILQGLRVHELGGHSDGVSVVTLGAEDSSDCAVFWSDVVPTTHHIQPPYIMAYDLDVARSFEVRSEWLARAAARGWLGLFYHDAQRAMARIVKDGKRYAAQAV